MVTSVVNWCCDGSTYREPGQMDGLILANKAHSWRNEGTYPCQVSYKTTQ